MLIIALSILFVWANETINHDLFLFFVIVKADRSQ